MENIEAYLLRNPHLHLSTFYFPEEVVGEEVIVGEEFIVAIVDKENIFQKDIINDNFLVVYIDSEFYPTLTEAVTQLDKLCALANATMQAGA